MKALSRGFVKLLLVIGLFSGGAVVGQESSPNLDDQMVGNERSWKGKSGHKWLRRTDHANREISFRREGSKGFEIQFLYEGDSRRPIAARLAGQKWHHKKASLIFRDGSVSECGKSDLASGILPALVRSPIPGRLTRARAINSYSSELFNGKINVIDTPENNDWQYWETYNDLALYMDDVNSQFDLFYDPFLIMNEDELRDCKSRCDMLYDPWFLGCGLMFDVPPVGVACLLTVIAGKTWCLRRCR